MIITTLPISYRRGRSLKIFTTTLTASTLSKLTGCKLILPLNILGLRHGGSPQDIPTITRDFGMDLKLIGVGIASENIRTDVEKNFQDFVRESLTNKSIEHHIQLSRCPCGVVELPSVALETINSQGRGKNFVRSVCKNCNQPTEIVRTVGLTIPFLSRSHANCLPTIQADRLSVVYKEVTRYPLIITKRRVPGEHGLESGDYVIDPDCTVGLYPYFLARELKVKEIGLIVGFTTLPQVCRALAISSSLFPEIKLNLFIHPGIKFLSEALSLPRTPFVEYTGNHALKDWATTLILSLQQTRLESVFCESDLIVAKNTRIARITTTQTEKVVPGISFEHSVKLLNRTNITQVYRKIRQRIDLSPTELLIAQATL